jgi:hypothetical protein
MMHRLDIQIEEFSIRSESSPTEWVFAGAVIYVDRMPVTEFLAQFEPEIRDSPYSRSRYGRWIGIDPDVVRSPSRSFFGAPDEKLADYNGRVPLCACSECGMYSCDGVWTRITILDATATWTDFIANPVLNPVALKAIPPLNFEIEQYREALRTIRNAEQGVAPNA